MFTADSHDPFFVTRLRHEQPRLQPNHITLVRLAHAASLDELASLDQELEVLAARRRATLDHLAAYRRRLWPGMRGRHHRKTCRAEDNPMPPAAVDAEELWGGELRQAAVQVLRRHGAQTLREIHGLLHRYGYVIEGCRPVQRLADALAYEVRHGRCVRATRGVYGPVDSAAELSTLGDLGAGLQDWMPPGDGGGGPDRMVDPSVRADPERWSGGSWPSDAQAGSDLTAVPDDPADDDLGVDLDFCVRATRARVAALYAERLGPPPPRYSPTRPRPTHPTDPAFDTLRDDSSTIRSPMSANEVDDHEWEEPDGGTG